MMVLLFIDIERGTLRQNKNILLSFFRSLAVFLFTVVSACWQQPHGHHLFRFICTAFYNDKAKNICVLGFRHMVRILKDPLTHGPTLQYATYVLWFRALETPEMLFWNGDPVCSVQLVIIQVHWMSAKFARHGPLPASVICLEQACEMLRFFKDKFYWLPPRARFHWQTTLLATFNCFV